MKILTKNSIIGIFLIAICIIIGSVLGMGSCLNISGEQLDNNTRYNTIDDNIQQTADITISSEEDWILFSENVNKGTDYANSVIYIISDLDFSNYADIKPVGTYQHPFRGKLYGNGFVLSNINIKSNDEYVGLIGMADNAMVDGLYIRDCSIYSKSAAATGGIIAHSNHSKISNCQVEGELYAESGSVGGIVGTSLSSDIYKCNAKGNIIGSTTSSWYGGIAAGNGGIVGSNNGSISLCNNYASVSDNCEIHESNTIRSGGITGYNYSSIENCVNYGTITGGGIAKDNLENASIVCCFNMGSVYSGISLGSFKNSTVEYCVNLGEVSGRYAGDIVSWWGQGSEENIYGKISNCIYVNSSGVGVARKKYFSASSIVNNYKISRLNTKYKNQIESYLMSGDFRLAYDWLLNREQKLRVFKIKIITSVLLLMVCLSGVIFICFRVNTKANRYQLAKKYMNQADFWLAYKTLQDIKKYKDSDSLMLESIKKMFGAADDSGILRMGMLKDGTIINWVKISASQNQIFYLAESALAMDRINQNIDCKDWNFSQLAEKLNTYYKENWFGITDCKYISVNVTLPDIKVIEQNFCKSNQRICFNKYGIPGMLTNSGGVYWWLKGEIRDARMPFVSSAGLISDKGRLITSDMAVRPMIKVELLYEESK